MWDLAARHIAITTLALDFYQGMLAWKGNCVINIVILLLPFGLIGLAALIYVDFIAPRKRRSIRRRQRKEARRLGKFRMRISTELWALRKTRRLSDQRELKQKDE
jgi:hypothetical protein